jgi:outer membrane receptor protein involved in Fe transport
VSTLVDGAAQSWSGQQYLDVGLWDVEQMEVLRGPQSTIQGRNSIAGAVVVKTKDPSFKWESAVRAGHENERSRNYLAGVVSGPLIDDELAFRLAAEGTKGHGFIDYVGNYPWDPSQVKNQTVRGKLLWAPKSIQDLLVKLTFVDRRYEGEYLLRTDAMCDNSDCANDGDLFRGHKFRGLYANTRRQDSKSNTLNLDVDYQFSDALSGYLFYSYNNDKLHFEQSDAGALMLNQKHTNHTLEGRLVYQPEDGRLSGVAGVYYFKNDETLYSATQTALTFDGDGEFSTLAGYGEATIGIGERLDLIVGARVERENQKRDMIAWPATTNPGHFVTDIGETMFLPKAGIAYKLPNTTFGFTVRKGYNPGGAALDDNLPRREYYEYDKETVLTYELSSRSMFLDNRLAFNATAFRNDYKDYQAMLSNRLANIAEGHSYGLELDAEAQITSSLNLYGSAGWLKTKVTDGGIYGTALEGNEFNYAPHFTANLGFKKKFGDWFVSGNVSYTGEYHSGVENDQRAKAGDYTLANLHAGYDNGVYAIRAYVKNLFDQDILYSKSFGQRGTNYVMSGSIGTPRTVGITLDYRF